MGLVIYLLGMVVMYFLLRAYNSLYKLKHGKHLQRSPLTINALIITLVIFVLSWISVVIMCWLLIYEYGNIPLTKRKE